MEKKLTIIFVIFVELVSSTVWAVSTRELVRAVAWTKPKAFIATVQPISIPPERDRTKYLLEKLLKRSLKKTQIDIPNQNLICFKEI